MMMLCNVIDRAVRNVNSQIHHTIIDMQPHQLDYRYIKVYSLSVSPFYSFNKLVVECKRKRRGHSQLL